ncbi:hypothetical protein D3C76_1271540 [compost metagenome]
MQDIVTLFLAAGETDVHGTGQQIFRHFQQFDLLFHQILEVKAIKFFLATVFAHRIQRSLQEELITDARDLDRILEGHKDAFTRAVFRRQFE